MNSPNHDSNSERIVGECREPGGCGELCGESILQRPSALRHIKKRVHAYGVKRGGYENGDCVGIRLQKPHDVEIMMPSLRLRGGRLGT